MRKLLLFFLLCISFLSCSRDEQNNIDVIACGCEQPQKELPWLKKLIGKAETDKTGNYAGVIWLENYNGQDIFVTNMMLGSGGVLYYIFDCFGNHLANRNGEDYCPSEFVGNNHFFVEDENDFGDFLRNAKLNVIIYAPKNYPYE